MRQLEIAVAGCGIAGLACALSLARQGHKVTVYERFAAPGPVGSGLMLQPTGMAVLHALGLLPEVVARGAPIAALLGRNSEGERVLEAAYADLPFEGGFGLGIHRASLFAVLFAACLRSGAALDAGREIVRIVESADGARLVFADGQRSRPHDLVIDALGSGSPLVPAANHAVLPYGALWTTLDWPDNGPFHSNLLEQRYCRAHRMIGLLPTGEGRAALFWSLRASEFDAWSRRGIMAFRGDICRLWPECEHLCQQIDDPGRFAFARYAHRTSPAFTGGRVVHIGDAWHCASPQLGQGANMALLDAWALAWAMSRARSVEDAWAGLLRLRGSHVRLYQWLTWAFTPPFQSDSIWPALLRDLVLAPASRVRPGPALKARLVSGLVGAGLDRMGLAVPDYTRLRPGPAIHGAIASRAISP